MQRNWLRIATNLVFFSVTCVQLHLQELRNSSSLPSIIVRFTWQVSFPATSCPQQIHTRTCQKRQLRLALALGDWPQHMAELLRRVKSTRAPKLSPAIDQSSTIAEQQILPIYKRKHYSIFTSTSNKRSTDHERIESADLIPTVTAVEARDHPGAVHQGSLTQLRQRLRHKASTFSLRTRDRQALARIEPTRRQLDTKTTKHEHFQHEQLLEDHTASFTVEYRTALRLSESPLNLSVLPDVTETVLYRSPTNSTVCTTDIAVQAAQSISLNKPPPLELQQTVSCSKDNSSPTGRSLPISTNPQALQVIHPQQHETATGSWVTMSDKNAPPPLPFEQLKEITTSVSLFSERSHIISFAAHTLTVNFRHAMRSLAPCPPTTTL